MTEELRILRSVNPELSLSSNSLEGGGVSPQETDQFPKSKSTSNLLTLPQEGPTKTNILPKSPTISGSDYNLEDFFACLPNGMVKVSPSRLLLPAVFIEPSAVLAVFEWLNIY